MPLVDQVSWGLHQGFQLQTIFVIEKEFRVKGLGYEMRTGSEWVTISTPGITLKLIELAVFLKLE